MKSDNCQCRYFPYGAATTVVYVLRCAPCREAIEKRILETQQSKPSDSEGGLE